MDHRSFRALLLLPFIPVGSELLAGDGALATSAMVYPSWSQRQSVAYVITHEEYRESDDPRLGAPTLLSLKRVIHLTLEAESDDAEGEFLRCTLDRIQLAGDSAGQRLEYDSQHDKSGEGNSVADLLSRIVGQQFRVRLDKAGSFAAVHGLDVVWRSHQLLAASPRVLSVQLLFRDQGMLELLRDALCPPSPAKREAMRAPWTARCSLSIPGVTPLEWSAEFQRATVDPADGGLHLIARGGIEVVRPTADVGTAGLRASVVQGERHAEMQLESVSRQVLRQEIAHELILALTLVPPREGQALQSRITQKIRLRATRQ